MAETTQQYTPWGLLSPYAYMPQTTSLTTSATPSYTPTPTTAYTPPYTTPTYTTPSYTAPTTTASDWYNWATQNAPTTPYWLPQFAPGEVAGQPMTGYPVKIPSGQLWYQTPWSQRQGLQAYINRYAGTVGGMIAAYQDMLEMIYRMLPQRAPSRATRWAPTAW